MVAALLLVAMPARADETAGTTVERRGLRRAGIAMFTAGVSALPSSAALLITTDGRMAGETAGMVVAGHLLMGAAIPMWVAGAQGRRTTPRNRELMYTGLVLAGMGLAALPPSSALFAASFDDGSGEGARDRRRTAALLVAGGANLLMVAGIPMWAIGAASPEDGGRLGLSLGPAGVTLRGQL